MPHSGSHSHNSHHVEPLEIHLESTDLVLRGFTGEELDPAVLNGELVVNLLEATNLREISLIFTGSAKVSWRDSSTHHYDHPLFFHDFNFLNPSSSSAPHSSSSSKNAHSHTLKAGRHVFPFSVHVPGSLPATLRTYSGTCLIEYRLKAVAMRPGITSADWKTRRVVRISRGFGADAVEYNQTLEIENTWPGKVMYAFIIPHKAYAAGETIPVSVKFSPMAKGVRMESLVTTIREHTTVHSKNSSHSEARDATVVKYGFLPDAAIPKTPVNSGFSTPQQSLHGDSSPARIESNASISSMMQPHTMAQPLPASGSGSGSNGHPHTPTTTGFLNQSNTSPQPPSADVPVASGSGRFANAASRLASAQNPSSNAANGPGSETLIADHHSGEAAEQEEEELWDDGVNMEVDVVVDVPIPIWTAPTHTVHPVFITHKIKWSAFIRNPDGHVSELRCALPIHILASSLAEEARLASAGSRNLLFGESGVLARSDVPQVDLPSYQDHVMDRVANAETASFYTISAGFAPTPWSSLTSPNESPFSSPPPSRPGSPGRTFSSTSLAAMNSDGQSGSHLSTSAPGKLSTSIQHLSRLGQGSTTRHSSGTATPASPALSDIMGEHPEDHRNWIDSELMGTLSLDSTTSPPGSNPPSRPASRPGSRPGSPDRDLSNIGGNGGPTSGHTACDFTGTSTSPNQPEPLAHPQMSRSNTSGSGFFHGMHLPKPLRPLTAFSRTGSSTSVHQTVAPDLAFSEARHGKESHPSASALSNALAAHAAKAGGRQDSLPVHTHSAVSNSPNSHSGGHSPGAAVSTEPLPQLASSAMITANAGGPLAYDHHSSSSVPSSPTRASRQDRESSGAEEEVDYLSVVPSYDVAARGFLGGGVVPINPGLPNYED